MTDIETCIKLFGIVLITQGPLQCALQCLRHDLRNKVARSALSLARIQPPIHKVSL
jgi:hypothetical protein